MNRLDSPLIAINGLLVPGAKPALRLDNRYAEAVLAAGGVPLAIPPIGGPRDLEALLERVDGLLLTGGDDFHTDALGLGPTHPETELTPREKQEFDVQLARAALARRMPVLGICYGMQLLALIEGAALLQHLPDDRPESRDHRGGVVHDVKLHTDSKLLSILGVESVPVVSRHHQALASVPSPWRVVAEDDQGLIEAIERPDLAFAIGVQWHPELSPSGSEQARLFRAFVAAAGMAQQRDQTSRVEFQRSS